MDSNEFVQWLKNETLFEAVNRSHRHMEHVLDKCLGAKHEEVLLVGDLGKEDHRVAPLLLGSYVLAAKRLGLRYKLVIQPIKGKGQEANEGTIEAMKHLNDKSIIFWALSGKPGSLGLLGNSFRGFNHQKQHRFASTTGLGVMSTGQFKDLVNAINVDYTEMRGKARRIKEALDVGNEVIITTDKGTSVTFDIKLKTGIPNDAQYHIPGTG